MPTDALPDFYSAVFFDMDGLLVDSEPLWLISETQMMAQYGYEWLRAMRRNSSPVCRAGSWLPCTKGRQRGKRGQGGVAVSARLRTGRPRIKA